MKQKIFVLCENGYEEDNRGVTIVFGPPKSNLKKLHAEYRALGYRKYKLKELHAVETSETLGFADWLIANKGFAAPKDVGVFYVDVYKEEEHIKEYNEIRENPETPKTVAEAKEKIAAIMKTMKKPIVQQADDIKLRILQWLVYDADDDEKVQYIRLPLEWAARKS